LHALTFGAHHMACTSALGRYFPGALRSRASALYSTLGYGVPGVLGGVAGGTLSDAFGLAAVFWGSAVAAVLALGCYGLCAGAEQREAKTAAAITP
jgi:MFS transporter, PPP family, 3-phenylpropionic acid transporter